MGTAVEITCVTKRNRTDPHERIEEVGGPQPSGGRWKMPLTEAVNGALSGKWDFFVRYGGRQVKVIVARHNGNPYLKTENDGIQPDNLLALSSCPVT